MSSPPSVCATRGCLHPFRWLPRSCTPPHTPRAFCFPGQEQPEPPSSGSRSIPPALHRNPEPKHGAVLAPAPRRQRLRACPHPAAGHRTQQGAGEGWGGGENEGSYSFTPPRADPESCSGAGTRGYHHHHPRHPCSLPILGQGRCWGSSTAPPGHTHTHSSGFTLRSHSGWRIPAIPASLSFLATITPSATL